MADYVVSDANLTNIANTIRAKGGTSVQLEFPTGFVSAIADIQRPTDLEKYITGELTFTDFSSDVEELAEGAFNMATVPINLNFPKLKKLKGNSTFMNSHVVTFKAPLLEIINTRMFQTCTTLTSLVLQSYTGGTSANVVFGCTALVALDIGPNAAGTFASGFAHGCRSLSTIVLRRSESVTAMYALNSIANTPFANGGSGGTIYIPKVLYDHLGDGTSLDYQAATNWSTVHGYGTITWAKIEGSIYETQYVDGTPIASGGGTV